MKTAIDWLMDQYKKDDGKFMPGVYEQAKEMEKEQIMNDYRHGHIDGFTSANHLGTEFENEEDYYNQTYNQNK